MDANLEVTGPVMHPAVTGLLRVTKVKALGRQVPLDVEQADISATFTGYNATVVGDIVTPDGMLRLKGDADWQNRLGDFFSVVTA